jgi:hypothetical protein
LDIARRSLLRKNKVITYIKYKQKIGHKQDNPIQKIKKHVKNVAPIIVATTLPNNIETVRDHKNNDPKIAKAKHIMTTAILLIFI